ncbi:class I SAM-dependent methyltransferase [Kribbella sandramycini]|nr:class I SAM-dependent methyltransferase [Kribbella sandramycini]MBB6569718.1 SAM-dependent methyltransferase [Kribbella sandramycini]
MTHGHGQAEILELDAEVLREQTAGIVSWLPVEQEPREIVDLAAGTGAGTFALLERFPAAQVTAVDASAAHLEQLRAKGGGVRTVVADLDDEVWPELGTPELVWASASMHHLADPDAALRKVRALLAPDGLFAVVEVAGQPRFLPGDAVEEQLHAAADRLHADQLPHRGADWGPMLRKAGFTVAAEVTIDVEIEGSRTPGVGRYALGVLSRLRHSPAVAELSAEDLTALDQLLDTAHPHSLLRRTDLVLHTQRRVWAAHREN